MGPSSSKQCLTLMYHVLSGMVNRGREHSWDAWICSRGAKLTIFPSIQKQTTESNHKSNFPQERFVSLECFCSEQIGFSLISWVRMSLRELQILLWQSLCPSVHCGRTTRRWTVLRQHVPAPLGTKRGDAAFTGEQGRLLGNKCVSAKLWMGSRVYLLNIFHGKIKRQIWMTAKQASKA